MILDYSKTSAMPANTLVRAKGQRRSATGALLVIYLKTKAAMSRHTPELFRCALYADKMSVLPVFDGGAPEFI
jgi:hypothetical protein